MSDVGFIKPVQHSTWLAKLCWEEKNGQFLCCIDFRAFNIACLEDEVSLLNVHILFDAATARHLMFSCMNCSNGYNHIKMDPLDVEKTANQTPMGISITLSCRLVLLILVSQVTKS